MNTIQPLVSVVISVLDGENTIERAIKSVQNQTYKNLDIVVIDNGSSDGTQSIIRERWRTDVRIRCLRNHEPKTLSEALNWGLKEARGKYIARLDADDYSFSRRIENQVRYMETHPDCGVIGTFYHEKDKRGNSRPRKQNPVDNPSIQKAMARYNPVAHSTAMIRRQVLDRVPHWYDPAYEFAQDYDLWFRLAHAGVKFHTLPDYLVVRTFEPDYKKMKAQEKESLFIRENLLCTHSTWGNLAGLILGWAKYWFIPMRLREYVRKIREC